uniref:Uncharacterized protein n=1 Tax=Clastoptera arizonana TaxID=38151 RepID=A0A1B6DMP1_9HEMI
MSAIVCYYPETTSFFGGCDCTAYLFFFFSIVMFSFGTFVTITSLIPIHIKDNLILQIGHMWVIGPICFCSGIMMGIKILLYLRRKSMIEMLLRQRTFLRGMLEVAQQSHMAPPESVVHSSSTQTLPPAYDSLMGTSSLCEVPPPSFEEALLLHNRTVLNDHDDNAESNCCKQINSDFVEIIDYKEVV